MRTLLLALLVGVSYVANLAPVQAVASEAAARTVNESAYKLVEQDQRTRGDSQQVARSTRWIAIYNVGESTPVTARGTGADASTGSAAVQGTPATVAGPQAIVDGGWVKDCPCDGNCVCIDPSICKNGDCKRNIIVLFTAKWCKYCPRQKAIAEQLQSEGYIVYIIDFDTHKKQADDLKVTTLPTTLVFENGKEVARYMGLNRAEQVKANVKKRVDQKDPPAPSPPPYNFSN